MKYIAGILTFILCMGFITAEAFSKEPSTVPNIVGIWDVENNQKISEADLAIELEDIQQVIVGETHNTKSVQNAEVDLLRLWLRSQSYSISKDSFTFAWEFLNWSDRYLIREVYSRYQDDQMDAAGFLEMIFDSVASVKEYIPLIATVKNFGGNVLATNLSRIEKAPVVEKGLSALDPKLLPPGFELGGKDYFERFEKAMGGHATPEKLKNYFAAQSLVDDVIAMHVTQDTRDENVFLVIGGFHTDYFDGAYNRLSVRDPEAERVLIRVVTASEFENEESFQSYIRHQTYGPVADFVIVVQ